MRKYLIPLAVALLCSTGLRAQYLTQSADGQGAVLLPINGLGVSFDIGKSELAVGINNYKRALDSSNRKFSNNYLVGLNLAVKNSDGLGNLFTTGEIIPGGNFLGFLGYSIHNYGKILEGFKNSDLSKIARYEQEKIEAMKAPFIKKLKAHIEVALLEIEEDSVRNNVSNDFATALQKAADTRGMVRALLQYPRKDEIKLKDCMATLKKLVNAELISYREELDRASYTRQLDTAFRNYACAHQVFRLTPFLFGGIQARNFSLFTGTNFSNFSNSFKDTLYRGGTFGFGFNLQYGGWWLGATYSYLDGDNFVNLSSKQYTIRTADTSGNQSMIAEKSKTAYSGKYAKVETNQLNIDLLREFIFNDSSRLLANAYYRGSLCSRDTAFIKNYSNIGIGLYFMGKKAKFLGGLYIELPDINNNLEKAKPEATRSIRPPLKKLTFGVVTKFSINSILGMDNRPRTPDPK